MGMKWNTSSNGYAKGRQINLCFQKGLLLVFFFVLTGFGGGQGVQFFSGSKSTTVDGIISKPKGNGPFPAVVLLHTCGGLADHVYDWAQKLVQEGYVTIVVDSFSARGISTKCGMGSSFAIVLKYDAYGARDHLKKLPFVNGKRIGVMGWSLGGAAAMHASHDSKKHFQAGVAFYPRCAEVSFEVTIPILLLMGKLDDWTPAENCLEGRAKPARKQGYPVEWKVYPNAHHGFDQTRKGYGPRKVLGHTLEFNAEATTDSWKQIRVFLNKHLRGGK